MNIDLVNQTLLEMQHVLEGALGDSAISISVNWFTSPKPGVLMRPDALNDFMVQAFKSSCDKFQIMVSIALERYFMHARLDTVEYLFLLDLQEMKDFLNAYPEVPVEWGASDGTLEVLYVN